MNTSGQDRGAEASEHWWLCQRNLHIHEVALRVLGQQEYLIGLHRGRAFKSRRNFQQPWGKRLPLVGLRCAQELFPRAWPRLLTLHEQLPTTEDHSLIEIDGKRNLVRCIINHCVRYRGEVTYPLAPSSCRRFSRPEAILARLKTLPSEIGNCARHAHSGNAGPPTNRMVFRRYCSPSSTPTSASITWVLPLFATGCVFSEATEP